VVVVGFAHGRKRQRQGGNSDFEATPKRGSGDVTRRLLSTTIIIMIIIIIIIITIIMNSKGCTVSLTH
jgi:hypothetical protein